MSATHPNDDELRREARKRIKARNDFWSMLAVFAVVTVILIAVWFFTTGGTDYFWPMWPIFGMTIAAVFAGLSAYGVTNRHITEAAVDAEVQRMQGRR